MSDRPAILLFDGTCGFCARTVQFVLAHERTRRSLLFVSLQSRVGVDVRARHAELRDVDSVMWLEPGDGDRPERVLIRSAAALRVLQYLGGAWGLLAMLGAIVPRVAGDCVYDFVARHRYRLAGAGPACLLPTPEQRARFIDWKAAP